MTKQRDRLSPTWTVRPKQYLNWLTDWLLGKRFVRVSLYEQFDEPPSLQKAIERGWNIFVRETNLPAAIALCVLCAAITYAWRAYDPHNELWAHMGGVTMEVFFVLIVFQLFEFWRDRRASNDRQREIIDDYKGWDGLEAAHRIAGAARRLNRNGISNINFSGLRLSCFSFPKNGISDLRNALFYDGSWGDKFKQGSVKLTLVNFDHVNCERTIFSLQNPFEDIDLDMPQLAEFCDCSFIRSNLRESIFNGASLSWTEAPPETLFYEDVDEETGETFLAQENYGPFDSSDLTWASFRGATFKNADFRGSDGITTADFYRAKGLEDAKFDSDEIRAIVLKKVEKDLAGQSRDLRRRR
jgi:uncharacterized protein YjbI with pentapeptide repeats